MSFQETVLIVETSKPHQTILCNLLKRIGFHVIAASDGLSALQFVTDLTSNGQKNLVGVISDIPLPNLDGISLLREIRNNKMTENLPFLIITAMADRENMLHARDLRASGYLLKPVTMEKLGKLLKEIFPSRQQISTEAG